MLQINLLNPEWWRWRKNISYRLEIIPFKIPIATGRFYFSPKLGGGTFYFSPKLGGEYRGEGQDHVRALLQEEWKYDFTG